MLDVLMVLHVFVRTVLTSTTVPFHVCVCVVWPFKQNPDRRSQLWRMTAEGQLVHIASSEASSGNMVLDIAGSVLPGWRVHTTVPLVVRKHSSSRTNLQTWKFSDVSF